MTEDGKNIMALVGSLVEDSRRSGILAERQRILKLIEENLGEANWEDIVKLITGETND